MSAFRRVARGRTGSDADRARCACKRGSRIGKIFADGAEVEFLSDQPGKQPLVFHISKLALHNLAEGQPLLYHASIQLPLPPADVYVQGKLSAGAAWSGGNDRHVRDRLMWST